MASPSGVIGVTMVTSYETETTCVGLGDTVAVGGWAPSGSRHPRGRGLNCRADVGDVQLMRDGQSAARCTPKTHLFSSCHAHDRSGH